MAYRKDTEGAEFFLSNGPPSLESMVLEGERPLVTVEAVVFSLVAGDLCVLLAQRSGQPFAGRWALPGGFVGRGESLEAAAGRVLAEEAGVYQAHLEQLYTFGDPGRDPQARIISVVYLALAQAAGGESKIQNPKSKIAWFSAYALPPLVLDHQQIVEYALAQLRHQLEYTVVAFRLLPDLFTLSELQQSYELILGETLDKRNFRRKVLSAGILLDTGKKRQEGEGRPARLYCIRNGAAVEAKTRRLFP
ncbi:MAG: NUDIX domain-containing protein [Chloroflexota bacterium]